MMMEVYHWSYKRNTHRQNASFSPTAEATTTTTTTNINNNVANIISIQRL